MFVSGNISASSFRDVSSSQKISTLGVRPIAEHGESYSERKRSKAKIKYKKIKGSDRILAPAGLQEQYYIDFEPSGVLASIRKYLNIVKENSNNNFFLSGVNDDVDFSRFFSATYLLTHVESPEPYQGEGTEAIQGLVEKSLLDEETEGRVILYLTPISAEDSSFKFFYKLGFRFAEMALNNLAENAIQNKLINIQVPEGYMYLPKENMPKLLRYGHLF